MLIISPPTARAQKGKITHCKHRRDYFRIKARTHARTHASPLSEIAWTASEWGSWWV
jgi:hypothetical protein